MALWFVDSDPVEHEPELLVFFDEEQDHDMTDGFCYCNDSLNGSVLYVDPKAICQADHHCKEKSPYEKCRHIMTCILERVNQMRIHTVLVDFDELVDYTGLTTDIKVQMVLIKEFRTLSEHFDIRDLYLFAYRDFVKDVSLDDIKEELGIYSLDWREEEQALPLDEDDEITSPDPASRLIKELEVLIDKENPPPGTYRRAIKQRAPSADDAVPSEQKPPKWETDVSFGIELDRLIQQKHLLPGEFARRANISRQTMTNLRKLDYMPQKYTALACVVALELNIDEANRLLGFAGYTLSSSLKADVIISFYISNGIFDIDRINIELFHANQHQLGSR